MVPELRFVPDILPRRPRHPLDRLERERAFDFSRHSDHQRTVGDVHPLGHQRSGAYQAIPADPGPVEDGGSHADQAAVANGAAVQHSLVTDRTARPDRQRKARIDMQDAMFLYVAVFSYDNGFIVAPQHRSPPNGGAGAKRHLSDDPRIWRDPNIAVRWNARGVIPQRIKV